MKANADADADEDERSLIEAAQADPARFVDLYERHFHRVYAYVSRRAPSRAEAEDVTSEVFEHALINLRKFEWRGVPFLAWLFRIAANALTDRWRRASRDSTSCRLMCPMDARPRRSSGGRWCFNSSSVCRTRSAA